MTLSNFTNLKFNLFILFLLSLMLMPGNVVGIHFGRYRIWMDGIHLFTAVFRGTSVGTEEGWPEYSVFTPDCNVSHL